MPPSSLSTLTPFLISTIRKPESFFVPQPEITTEALSVTKTLYDHAKAHEPEPFSPLPELITTGMDHEQIWAELELRNGPLLKFAKKGLKGLERLLAEEEDEYKEKKAERMAIGSEDIELEGVEDEGMQLESLEDNDDVLELEDLKGRLKRKSEVQQDEDEEDQSKEEEVGESDDSEQDGPEDYLDEVQTKSVRTSEVDDDFFNLTEFNMLTERFETQDMRSEDEEDGEDRIDLDMDPDDIESEGDDENEWDEEGQADAADIAYKDFFEPPPRSKTVGSGKRQHKNSRHKEMEDEAEDELLNDDKQQQRRDLLGDEHVDEDEDEDEDEDNAGDRSRKSKEELRVDKVRREIEKLEVGLVAEKDWTLAGEASSRVRPINSLLEEDLEFDHAVKPVPIITVETTETLEDMIRQRILDGRYDDVQRKRNPENRPFIPSKMIELSDEKSKKSLAEVYEEDYLKHSATAPQMHEKDAELLQKHKEIDDMFKTLCVKLDALSNFHFTPKPPKPEITVISDVPAISMEEAIPIHVSDATLLAPEEVYEPPKEGAAAKGKSEMDSMDKKRAVKSRKRAKKAERTMRERERKTIEKLKPGMGNKHAKEKAISSLIGKKNITFIDKEGNKKAALKKDKVPEMHSSKLKL